MEKRAVGEILLFFSLIDIIISFWNRDWSYLPVVTLPFFFTNIHVTGFHWFILSLIDEWAGYSVLAIGLYLINSKHNLIFVLYGILASSDVVLYVNYTLVLPFSISAYGIIWNDVLYLIMLPAVCIIVVFKLSFKKSLNS